jgi:sterol desaturase/sphingolipid hydroxylase (fatty acid hydroxylase superfamily)
VQSDSVTHNGSLVKSPVGKIIGASLSTLALVGAAFALRHFAAGNLKLWASQFLIFVPVFILSVTVFSVLERIFPAGPFKPVDGWVLNYQVALLYGAAGSAAAVLGVAAASFLDHRWGLGWIDLRFASGSGIGALVGALLLWNFIFDFFYYWLHRSQHKVSWLWQTHKLHHMDPELCALTVSRQHWLEDFIRIPFITIPMAVLFKLDRLDPAALGLLGGIMALTIGSWAVFIHANIRLHLGWASCLLAAPQVHRVHHSRLPEHRDRNFAAYFPIWDVIFGTYCAPGRHDFPPSGVSDEREVQSLMQAASLPFQGWWNLLIQRRRARAQWINSGG